MCEKHRIVGFFFLLIGLSSDETWERIWVFVEREPVVCTVEPDENDDIIICSSCSGFKWRHQFPQWRRLT